jgi:glycosyltransferase involved in cell wall biosynthesis
MPDKKDLSIILPLYNPHENWEFKLNNSISNLSQLFSDINFEIIIINDGSTIIVKDKIENLLRNHNNLKYLEYPENEGKGYAIKYGIKNSDSEYYLYSDHDFPFGYQPLVEIYDLLRNNNCDLVFGKRTKSYFSSLPKRRHIISKCLRTTNYIMLGFKVIDTQAGLKGFNERIKPILLNTKTDRFIFEFEFIRKCLRNNCVLVPINISADENISFSEFSLKVIFRELRIYIKLLFRNE